MIPLITDDSIMHSPHSESLDKSRAEQDHNLHDLRFVGEAELPECTRSSLDGLANAYALACQLKNLY